MKPKHILTLVALALAILSGGAIITQAQGPVTTTIGSPAVYDPELRAQADQSPEQQMQALINQERTTKNLPPLAINARLTQAALSHSQDMAEHNFCGHQGSDGSSPWDRIPRAGYSGSLGGENVACGQTSVQQAFDAWIASPGHRAIIDGQYGEVGLGWITKPGTNYVNYWTADFGGSPGQTTPGSNPGPILTNTPIPFLKTPTPFVQATATIPWWLLPTPTTQPPFYLPTATAPPYIQPTPIPQQGSGWRVVLDCNQFGQCTGAIIPK